MKRFGQILLGAFLVFLFVAIVYIGVVGVLKDAKKAGKITFSSVFLEVDTKASRTQMEKMTTSTKVWIEQEKIREKRIADYIDEKLASMTLEQKLAQMMILTNENDITASNLTTYQPGGIIFFEVDFKGKTIATVRNRVDTLQSYMTIPMFVGVDEEGGEVSRLKTLAEKDLPEFEGARVLHQQGENAIRQDTKEKAIYLKKLGVNLNFAPVADVVEDKSSYMYLRSASSDAEEVADYVSMVLKVMQENEIIGCIKHFPGYGNNVNTHDGLAEDNRSLMEYEQQDFVPFQTGIDMGVDMVMVSHIIMKAVDEKNPASLSDTVHKLLREDMEYNGVVIADDLNMQAILKTMTIEEATARAFIAGNDMVFSADFAASMKGAKGAVKNGTLSEEQVDASVKRVLTMKVKRGLIKLD